MEVYGPAVPQELLAPDLFIDSVPVEGDVFVLQEEQQQIVLLGGQGHGGPGPAHDAAGGVDFNVRRQGEDPPCLSAAAEDGFHPGQQLHQLEGLDDIVLRPQAQALHPVLQLSLGGEEDHRHLQLLAVFQELVAVGLGQHNVQQRQIEGLGFQLVRRVRPVRGPGAAVARPLQGGADEVGDGGLVLGNEDFVHGNHVL